MQVYNEQILPSGARGRLFPFRIENGDYWMSEQTRFLDADSYPKCTQPLHLFRSYLMMLFSRLFLPRVPRC